MSQEKPTRAEQTRKLNFAAMKKSDDGARERISRNHKARARRTFTIATSVYEQGVSCRPGLVPEDVIREEVDAMRGRLPGQEETRAIWEGVEIIAVIRPGPDGEPLVTRFDD